MELITYCLCAALGTALGSLIFLGVMRLMIEYSNKRKYLLEKGK